MATRQSISLTRPNDEWLNAQVASEEYSNKSEVVNDLIRRARERGEKLAAMQRLVDEGLSSGVGSRSREALFAEARKRAGTIE